MEKKEIYDWDNVEDENSKEEETVDKTVTSYGVVTKEKIHDEVGNILRECCDMMKLSTDDALILLIYYKWNWSKLQTEWFGKEIAIKKAAGLSLSQKPPPIPAALGNCPVCDEQLTSKNSCALACGHYFCGSCWSQTLKIKLESGKGCIWSTCPFLKCPLVVPHSLFQRYLPPNLLLTYDKYIDMSFIDNNKEKKWCPAKGCNYIIESYYCACMEVKCRCGCIFCFKCSEEAHNPATCDQLKAWTDKGLAENETMAWIKAHTKPCPKCKKPIEKNQGCNHMTCTQCRYEFCWICMGDWQKHNGDYGCNKINKQIWETQNVAKTELQRYLFYLERYENHQRAIRSLDKERENVSNFVEIMLLVKNIKPIELQFLTEAINNAIQAHRALSYSYVYGYYLKRFKDVELLEFMQKDIEVNCEHLHELIERKKDPFIDPDDVASTDFFRYKTQLAGLFPSFIYLMPHDNYSLPLLQMIVLPSLK